jgi:tetratricopeptide (TPR) repeat protein
MNPNAPVFHPSSFFPQNQRRLTQETSLEHIIEEAQKLLDEAHAKPNKRIQNCNKALELLGPNGAPNLRAQAHLSIANDSAFAHNLAGRNNHYLQAVKATEGANGDSIHFARAHIGLGNIRNGDLFQQIGHYRLALDASKHVIDNDLSNQAHLGLGKVYNELGQGDKASEHFNHVIQATPAFDDVLNTAHSGLKKARSYGDRNLIFYARNNQAQDLLTEAIAKSNRKIENCHKALRTLGPNGDSNLRAQAHLILANHGEFQNNFVFRLGHYQEALDLLGPNGNRNLRAQAHIGLGNARHGDQARHYQDALDVLGPNRNPNLRAQAYIGLGNLAGAQGKQEDARMHFKNALAIDGINQSLSDKANTGLQRNSPSLAFVHWEQLNRNVLSQGLRRGI